MRRDDDDDDDDDDDIDIDLEDDMILLLFSWFLMIVMTLPVDILDKEQFLDSVLFFLTQESFVFTSA